MQMDSTESLFVTFISADVSEMDKQIFATPRL